MPEDRTFIAPGPRVEGADSRKILRWVEQELAALYSGRVDRTQLELRPVHAQPTKRREGMIIYADGTDFDPGSGKGVYVWNGSAWAFLG